MKYLVFGDTGGHREALFEGLLNSGLDKNTLRLPADVTVVHCGDLIHRGPDSLGVLRLVDGVMEANPGRWIQLLGNHEFQYFRSAPTFWPAVIPVEGQLILQSWLVKGLVRPAFGLSGNARFAFAEELSTLVDSGSGVLFTHGGLTREFWLEHLAGETSAPVVAQLINSLPIPVVTTPGKMLRGFTGKPGPAGPVWAAGVDEVWRSWDSAGDAMPFMQIHGHSAPYGYDSNQWSTDEEYFRSNSQVVAVARLTVTKVAGNLQVALDPNYGVDAPLEPQPSLEFFTV